ncbi:RHS repeat-associated core domain-containing protein, partial [Streptomyces sp. SID337]
AARYYDPNIGRFTQPDPSGQEQNPYLYAEGDPVNRIDPTGLFDLGATIASVAVGAAATVAVGAATGNPVAAAAAGGCAGGAVGEGLSGGSAGDMGKACAAWGIGGAISGGLLKGIGV